MEYVAQLAEHCVVVAGVGGSSPLILPFWSGRLMGGHKSAKLEMRVRFPL